MQRPRGGRIPMMTGRRADRPSELRPPSTETLSASQDPDTRVAVQSALDEPDPRFVVMRTKLVVPSPRPQSVPRPHLVAELTQGMPAKVTLVCAPTGSGKTSLLTEWAASTRDVRVAWVSLDPGDDEPLRFWRYVAAALATVEPSLADTAQRRLRSPVVSIDDEILPVLVNDLARVAQPLVLVLDDLHVISSSRIAEQLGYVVDRMPRAVHLAIASQADPALRLGRLRAMGDLAELRAEQLRFTDKEAAALLNRVHGLDLAPEELATVQRRTEGWAAGLNLAALSLKRSGQRRRVLEELPADESFLVDYLWNEVVLGQPRTVRHFLMRTAILERLTGPLCDAVTERNDSDQMLRELERANLFVVPLDDNRAWFRYHHLFRDLLLRQLERFASDLIPDLHRRASTWYAANGFMSEAIDHAIAAGDVNYAADELEHHWLEAYSTGQATNILDWIDRLPEEAIAGHPALALARAGIARAMGRLDEVEPWLQRAEAAGRDAPASGLASSIVGGAAVSRSMYRLALGDVLGAITWGRRALELEPVEGSPEHLTAGYFLAIALFFEAPDQAAPLLRQYLGAVPPGAQDARRYFAMALLAEVHALRGELDEAERLGREALAVARSQQLEEHPPSEQVHVALGAVLLARDEVEAAEEQFERAAGLARRGGDRSEYAHALLWLGRSRARHRDSAGARIALESAREAVPELGQPSLKWLLDMLEEELGSDQRRRTPARELEPLTDSELRVLRLLPGDLTYREMAQHLYVSLNTVRTHSQRVRRKLGVSTRTEAVARARELGLL
jgi:LuxR family maltose regulon positive regulatory protein